MSNPRLPPRSVSSMRNFRSLPLLLLAALLFAATGCTTVNSRIKERYTVYSALDPATQDRLRLGRVDLGDTPDMVYIALGRPTRTTDRITADGRDTTWIYNSFYEEYAGTTQTGYRRTVIEDKANHRTFVRVEPVYTDYYRQRSEEYIRLSFKQGKVDAIEQTKG